MPKTTKTFHRRNLLLPAELCERVDSWHGGQSSRCYSLSSTGSCDYVSASMVDAAADELEGPAGPHDTAELKADREDLVGELRAFTAYASEHTTEEAGLGDVDSGYATWLMEDAD